MIETGGRHELGFDRDEAHEKLALSEARVEKLIRRGGCIDCAVGDARRNRDSSRRTEQPTLKGL